MLKQKAGADDKRSAPADGQQRLIVTLTCGCLLLCTGFFAGGRTFDVTALGALLSCGGTVVGIIGPAITAMGVGGCEG